MTPKHFNFQKTFYRKNYSFFNDLKNTPNFFGCWKVKYLWPILCLYFWGPKQWEGTISKKRRSFHWFSHNSELEATWTSLIGWPHKTSNIHYVYLLCPDQTYFGQPKFFCKIVISLFFFIDFLFCSFLQLQSIYRLFQDIKPYFFWTFGQLLGTPD